MADKRSLYNQVVELGITVPDYDDITGRELEALLETAAPTAEAEAKRVRVNNLRKNPVRVRGVEIEPKGHTYLTDQDVADEELMAKINHGVATGVYSIG